MTAARTGRRSGRVTGRVTARGTVLAAGLAMALVGSLAGCGGDDEPGRPVTASSAPGTGAGSQGVEPVDAEQVLNGAGLSLPAGATEVTVSPVPKEPFSDRYLVTFTTTPAAARELCVAAGLGGLVGPNPPLTAESQEVLGMTKAPEGAEGCFGSNPDDLAAQRTILFSGDPAKVWIAVWRMPNR